MNTWREIKPLRIVIPGTPVPWKRAAPRRGRKGSSNPAAMHRYKRHVQSCADATMLQERRLDWPRGGTYDVHIRMCFPDRKVRDDDNVEKMIKDALQGRLWDGDHWVRFRRITKEMELDRDNPRIELTVEVVSEVGDARE
jgi:Holliday junction resolvase RusA-like endonuclease